jgi:succinoglycan biosynthesis protein ExoM
MKPESLQRKNATGTVKMTSPSTQCIPHISVCVCTYKRPLPLKRLLSELDGQDTGGMFTYSIVVADNDKNQSAKSTIADFRSTSAVPLKYCVEPAQGIARARNKVIENAEGDFLAFIDDDEFPAPGWLLALFKTLIQFDVDGVLGPVKRHFDATAPDWFVKGKFLDRKVNPTGMRVEWLESRTGNVLLKREVVDGKAPPFRTEFKAGSDVDFFRRKMEEGRTFLWSAEAVVFEVVPSLRWTRSYLLKRALHHGSMDPKNESFRLRDAFKSAVAVPIYIVILPFAFLLGQHRFMDILIRLCSHLGLLLGLMGIHIVREEYLAD